jgi:hypothetical protein
MFMLTGAAQEACSQRARWLRTPLAGERGPRPGEMRRSIGNEREYSIVLHGYRRHVQLHRYMAIMAYNDTERSIQDPKFTYCQLTVYLDRAHPINSSRPSSDGFPSGAMQYR